METIKDTIEAYGGIQPPHLAFYKEAIRFNLESAMNSVEILVGLLDKFETDANPDILTDKILDTAQNMLLHTASASKYFWPNKKGENKVHKKRAQKLRLHFSVEDDSCIQDKNLRNALEHLDERLDNYLWSKNIVGNVIPAFVGPEMLRNQVPHHFFRAYFTDSRIFECLGIRLEIQPMIDEVYKLHRQNY